MFFTSASVPLNRGSSLARIEASSTAYQSYESQSCVGLAVRTFCLHGAFLARCRSICHVESCLYPMEWAISRPCRSQQPSLFIARIVDISSGMLNFDGSHRAAAPCAIVSPCTWPGGGATPADIERQVAVSVVDAVDGAVGRVLSIRNGAAGRWTVHNTRARQPPQLL
jgi:hypothetical protein